MGILTVQLKDERTAKLLRDLEELDLLKIVAEDKNGQEKEPGPI